MLPTLAALGLAFIVAGERADTSSSAAITSLGASVVQPKA